ncbi:MULTISPECIES: hypothetical protein [unclassified Roseivivax]|uniref:hypothetical protein n=1 Tax=Roseivivax sp. GX 12232 TaxID=2900547 RepID=UPI001E390BAA|nr:hypothetical protein [Roseivivax sp. GX 12232]MCE0504403.1 hypothetical protein [Roseivivax sp. GX 12232]
MKSVKLALLSVFALTLSACAVVERYEVELAYDPLLAKDGTVLEEDWVIVNTRDLPDS